MALKADKLTDTVLDLPNGNVCVIENGKISKILDMNTQKGKVVEITDVNRDAIDLILSNAQTRTELNALSHIWNEL